MSDVKAIFQKNFVGIPPITAGGTNTKTTKAANETKQNRNLKNLLPEGAPANIHFALGSIVL